MNQRLRVVVMLSLAIPMASACASRPWTEALFAKQEAEIDERFLGVERQVEQHDQRLTVLGGRVADLETTVTHTGEVARDARDRADVAVAQVAQVATLRTPRESIKARALFGTVHVLFGFDRSDLDEGAEKALLSVIKELGQNPNLTIDLEGGADSTGGRDYNVQLSHRRVNAVRRFLLARGVQSWRIMHSSGVGSLRNEGMPEEQKRRVAIKLMKAA